MAGLFASWTHGNSLVFENPGNAAPRERGWDGDVRQIGDWTAIGVTRTGPGAVMYVYDFGTAHNPKSGHITCHFAIPTPVIVNDTRSRLRAALIKCSTPYPQFLAITAMSVWDGPSKIIESNLPGPISDPLFRLPLPDQEVLWGINVALVVTANACTGNQPLTIHAVGIDFFV